MILLSTAYVVRREGYVLTRVCPSVCLSTPRGGTWPGPGGGGTPARSSRAEGTPPRVPPPVRPGQGVPLLGGTPPQVPPPIRPGRGVYPCCGSTPPWVPPHQTPPQVTDGVLDTPRSVCLLRSRRRTFLCFYGDSYCYTKDITTDAILFV